MRFYFQHFMRVCFNFWVKKNGGGGRGTTLPAGPPLATALRILPFVPSLLYYVPPAGKETLLGRSLPRTFHREIGKYSPGFCGF